MLKTLEQIDQDLIELLGKRIALAKASGVDFPAETLDIAQLLVQAGVPEFIWTNIINGCAAAVVSGSSTAVKPRTVTVIGGCGQMGRFFTQQLLSAGHNVTILEQNHWDHAEKLLQAAELVLICVPTEQTLSVIQKAAPYLTASTALVDITSIKTRILQAMLESHPGPVLSLHPMFGPSVQSFLSQNVIVCPGRQEEACLWFLHFIEDRGGNLIVCSPEEHDQMMVMIQAIRHFSTFGLGVFLAEAGIDLDRSLNFSSPPYRLQINMISRLFNQDPSLYLGIMLSSEERRQAISKLVETYSRLAQLVGEQDRAALIQEFETTRSVFQQDLTRARMENDYLINSLSVLLAANSAETKCVSNHSHITA